jgi:hypothetical protein
MNAGIDRVTRRASHNGAQLLLAGTDPIQDTRRMAQENPAKFRQLHTTLILEKPGQHLLEIADCN